MSRDYLSLGSTPCGEDCAQVGSDDYSRLMRRESRAYIGQLKRMFPDQLKTGIELRVKGFPHDYGTYHEVCVMFDDANEAQVSAAYDIESGLPETWDDKALIDMMPRIGDTLESDLANINTTYDRYNKMMDSPK